MEQDQRNRRQDDLKRQGEAYLLPGRIEAVEHEQAESKKRDEGYKSQQLANERNLVRLTFWLVIVGLLGTGIAVWQSFIADQAARAAEDSAAVAKASLVSVQRAFLNVIDFRNDKHTALGQKTFNIGFNVVWRNDGATPAIDTINRISVDELTNEPTDALATGRHKQSEFPVNFIAPRGTFPSGTVLKPQTVLFPKGYPPKQVTLRDDDKKIFIYGWIAYRDVFPDTEPHVTQFRRQATQVFFPNTGTNIPDARATFTLQMTNCRQHNCIDRRCPNYEAIVALLPPRTK